MELHLKITGVLFIVLAILHAGFPKYFHWKQELASLSIINRQMMYVHSFFIALVVGMIGLLCVTSAAELTGTVLGKRISLGLAVFWSVRLISQFFIYSPKTWKGKRFETVMHIVFTLLWIYVSAVFFLAYFN